MYFLAFAFRPANYIVTAEEMIIRNPLLNVLIKITGIKCVVAIVRNRIRSSLRNLAKEDGGIAQDATRSEKPVLVTTSR
jgi:hypothetical protein